MPQIGPRLVLGYVTLFLLWNKVPEDTRGATDSIKIYVVSHKTNVLDVAI